MTLIIEPSYITKIHTLPITILECPNVDMVPNDLFSMSSKISALLEDIYSRLTE